MDDRQLKVTKAELRPHHTVFSVWIVPTVAAIIALYMVWHSYGQHGPTIMISFNSAEGLVAGQTQIRYRAVALGTVSEISLDSKLQKVIVKAKMTIASKDLLTDKAQFWVVRPRLSPGSLSGIETLVSGSYIQCDPGLSRGNPETEFTGLDDLPATRSDERGVTFKLVAERLGSISKGSAVYFRDINVGEVLNYDIGDGFGPITLTLFIRDPYDKMVGKSSRFWNSSGVMINVGPTGLQLQLQSLQALLTGGIAFSTPKHQEGPPDKDQVFQLYANKQEADVAGFRKPISYVSYFDSSFKNIGAGSPVYIKGIQVGEINSVKLVMDYDKPEVKVRVRYAIQPERAFLQSKADEMDPFQVTRHLIEKGLRVKVDSGGLLPGQSGLTFEFLPKPAPAEIAMEGDSILMPSAPGGGGLDSIAQSLSDVAAKLNEVPIDRITDNLNNLLMSVNGTAKGFDQNSDFLRDMRRTLDQVNDAARSVRLLSDYLTRHPESLIRGRNDKDKGQ